MKIKNRLIVAVLIAMLIFALVCIFDIPCLVRLFLGVSCPGCGMTRAYLCLLTLNFEKAFYYHPLWWLIPVLAVFFLALGKYERAKIAIIAFGAIALIAVYILRWIFGPEEIVYFDFTKTIYYEVLK